MDRPATSKSRGVCRYYTTSRGCFAGDHCKFLHGKEEKLTPYDQSKACRFYAQGYCRRGDECWFRHGDTPTSSAAQAKPEELSEISADDVCNICLDKPATYGLLAGCGHDFCLKCIRQWRDPAGKSGDMVLSGVTKKCPLCRSPSRFITPSSITFAHDDPKKFDAIERYKESMSKVPCRYFAQSPLAKRFCPFGKDCFYQHSNEDGMPYIFPHGVEHYMRLFKHRANQTTSGSSEPFHILNEFATTFPTLPLLNPIRPRPSSNSNRERNRRQHGNRNPFNTIRGLFNNPLDDLNATLDALRASLPAFMDRLNETGDVEEEDEENDYDSRGPNFSEMFHGSGGEDLDGDIVRDYGDAEGVNALEQLADRMLESLAAHRDLSTASSPLPSLSTLPPPITTVRTSSSDNPLSGSQIDDDELPPLEIVSGSESGSSRGSSPIPNELPRLTATSRFSTVVGNRSRERVFIDVLSDDESEAENPANEHEMPLVAGPSVDEELRLRPEVIIPEMTQFNQETVDLENTPTFPSASSRDRDSPEHDAEPPFVTDGRGRVVWSSMRSGRATPQTPNPAPSSTTTAAQSREAIAVRSGTPSTHEHRKSRRTGRESVTTPPASPAVVATPNITSLDNSSPGFTTDGRGRVIGTGSPVPENPEAEGGEDDADGTRRSFLGRMFDVVFS